MTYRRQPVDRAEWLSDAACRGLDASLFFPVKGDAIASRSAKAICKDCPVKTPCLESALVDDDTTGIWGGSSERDRKKIRRSRRRGAA